MKITIQGRSYDAVDHDDVTRLVKPVLEESGVLAFPTEVQCTLGTEDYMSSGNKKTRNTAVSKVQIRFINVDDPKEELVTEFSALAYDSGDKAPGKAHSMATKICYLKVFKIPSGDKEESRDSEGSSVKTGHVFAALRPFVGMSVSELGKPDIEELVKKLSYWSAQKANGTDIKGKLAQDLNAARDFLKGDSK